MTGGDFSVCVIDDSIPSTGTTGISIIRDNELRALDANEWGNEELALRSFVESLLNTPGIKATAFKNPEFFFNFHLEHRNEIFRPEVIVLDWDFGGSGQCNTKEHLVELLNFSFSYIFIFSGPDTEDEISELCESVEFSKWKYRIFHLVKNENSADHLMSEINASSETLAFKIGSELRQSSIDAMEKMLIDLGNSSAGNIKSYLNVTEDSSGEFLDLVGERYKSYLADSSSDSINNLLHEADTEEPDQDLEVRLWSQRLYFYPKETEVVVRKGDIIKYRNSYYVVISANCDLAMFWHKNHGYLSCVQIHHMEENSDTLKRKILNVYKDSSIANMNFKPSSLLSKFNGLTEGHFSLPFVANRDNGFEYFFVNPKNIQTIELFAPHQVASENKKAQLTYSHFTETDEVVRICRVAEPFLTQMVEHVFMSLRGFGVANFSQNAGAKIHSMMKGVVSE